jgi:2-dehydro-3-deoxyphosphogalactonate aldolase
MSQLKRAYEEALAACPLVAILRGITPDEIEGVGDILVEAGFRLIEVPLNSPQPFQSIERLAARHGDDIIIGAGTVLMREQVKDVLSAGGRLVVAPNVEPDVIEATVAAHMISLPGFYTPSEAFRAVDAGAHGLKLFPAEMASPAALRAMRAVLPDSMPVFVVGGVQADSFDPWLKAGAHGFGTGGSLYRPGADLGSVRRAASVLVAGFARAGVNSNE